MDDKSPAAAVEIGRIDPGQFLSTARQSELIASARRGMHATAIRMAIRETVFAVRHQCVVRPVGDE